MAVLAATADLGYKVLVNACWSVDAHSELFVL